MKKLISVIVVSMMLSISAQAATTYDVDNKSVSTDNSGYKTILISKGEAAPANADEIVYVNQADVDSTFAAGTEFLLKENIAEGSYTVRFGGASTASTTFYVGLAKAVGDIAMTAVDGGIQEVTGGYGVGYTITAPGTYNSLLIKTKDTIVGCGLETVITTDGDVTYGVQINAETKAELESIEAVYLSARIIGTDVVLEEVQQ